MFQHVACKIPFVISFGFPVPASSFQSFVGTAGIGNQREPQRESKFRVLSQALPGVLTFDSLGSVCKVRTQDPENLDEEVKSLVTAWRLQEIPQCQALPKTSRLCLATSSSTSSPSQGRSWILNLISGGSLRPRPEGRPLMMENPVTAVSCG